MAEQLRMEAVVTDKFSGPLKRLQERLSGIREPEHLKELGEHFDRARERVEKLSEAMKVGLEPAMSGLGIAGLTLGGTFAGLMQATRSFAETTASLSRLSNETGISIDRFRELDSVFNKLGVKAEVVNGSIVTFRQNLHDIQKNRGATFGWLTAQEPQLAKQLHDAKNPDEAYGRALGFLQRIPDPVERQTASQQLFGTPDIARIGEMSKSEVHEAIRDADKAQGQISEGSKKAAEDFEKLTGRLKDALTGLRDDVGSKLLPFVNGLVSGAANFVENNHGATVAGGVAVSGGATVVATHLGRRLFRHWLGRASSAAAELPTSAAARAGRAAAPGVANDNWAFHAANENVAAEATEAGSIFSRMAPKLGAGLRLLGPVTWPLMVRDVGESMNPTTPEGAPYRNDQLPGWPATFEQSRRAGEEYKRDPEAARGRAMMQHELTDLHTNAVREGTVEGLKKATPDAEKQVKGWFGWLWNSSADGGALPFGGGGAKLLNASYEVGGGGSIGGGGGSRARSYGGGRFNALSRARGDSTVGSEMDIAGSSAGNLTKLIDESAKKYGIDPRFMEGIRAGESGHGSKYDKKDDAVESSWGPFQLNRRRGLGVQFEKETGLDVRDPRTIPAQANWVARYLSKGGSLRAWMGYHGPRDADPRWGDSGYRPSEGSSSTASGFHLPKGGYWAKDSAGNPVAVGPDGAAIQSSRAAPGTDIAGRMYPKDWRRVLDTNRALTQGTGMGFLGAGQVNPEGNVTVNLHHFPSGVQAKTSADGFFKDVKVNRGRQMSEASQET